MMTLTKVFVYGTLKRGEPNHHWFNPNNGLSKFVDIGKTVIKYPLIIASKYNIPFLLDHPGAGHNVQGEVYEIDEKMLSNLDILEDHPNFYNRKKNDVILSNGEIENCWAYFIEKFRPELLEKEMLENYSSRGPHKLVYAERYKRDPSYDPKNDILLR